MTPSVGLFCLLLVVVRSAGVPGQRANVEIKFNCANVSDDQLSCYANNVCQCDVYAGFSAEQGERGPPFKGFYKRIAECKGQHARTTAAEVFRFKRDVSNVSEDLYFLFSAECAADSQNAFQVPLQVLPHVTNSTWLPLPLPADFKLRVTASARINCLPRFSGARCEDFDEAYFMVPSRDPRAKQGVTFGLETILAAVAAGCCLVVLLSLTVWCCVKRSEGKRSDSTGQPDLSDVYEMPYEDLAHDRGSYCSLEQHDATLDSTLEDGPELPPRRVSISSENICSREEEEEEEEEEPFL